MYSLIGAMESIIINVGDFSPNQQVSLLLSIIESYNKENDSLRHEKNGLKRERDALESALSDCKEKLSQLNVKIGDFTQSSQARDERITALESSYNELKLQEEAQANQFKEQLATANSTIAGLNRQLVDKDGAIASLNETLETTSLKVDELNRRIVNLFSVLSTPIVRVLANAAERTNNDQFSTYCNQVSETIRHINADSQCFEDINKKLLLPDGVMARLASLIWWHSQETMRELIDTAIEDFVIIEESVREISHLLSVFGIEIFIPSVSFANKIEKYGIYNNGDTRIYKLFPELERLQAYTFCEVYSVATNEKAGSCYYSS